MRKISVFALLVSFSALGSCGGSTGGGYGTAPPPAPPPPPANTCPANTVCMQASVFNPTSLSVPTGTVVSFTNDLGVTHNVVFDAPVAPSVTDIGTTSSGTVTRTFSASGTWKFHCTIHGGMNGEIVVP